MTTDGVCGVCVCESESGTLLELELEEEEEEEEDITRRRKRKNKKLLSKNREKCFLSSVSSRCLFFARVFLCFRLYMCVIVRTCNERKQRNEYKNIK